MTKIETVIRVATEKENGTESGTEKIRPVGKECLDDTGNVPGVEIGIRNAHGNGKGTEITETDTADLVSADISLITPSHYWLFLRSVLQ